VLTVNTNGYGTATGDGVKDRDNAPFAITATPGAGYVFAGWSGPDAAKVAVTNAASTTIDTLLDATVTANFRLLLSVCTVTFDAQGGAVSPTGAIVTNGLPYGPLPTPAFAGYTFSGWYANALVTDAEILSNTVVTATANHTLYAKWTPLVTARGTPYLWLDQHRLVAGGNYEAADTSDSDGDGMTAWQEYVAGTVPTNGASVLRAVLSQKDGQMSVHWAPDLTDAVPVRMYSVYGAASLQNGIPSSPFTNIAAGTPVPLQSLSSNRFFKVGVRIH